MWLLRLCSDWLLKEWHERGILLPVFMEAAGGFRRRNSCWGTFPELKLPDNLKGNKIEFSSRFQHKVQFLQYNFPIIYHFTKHPILFCRIIANFLSKATKKLIRNSESHRSCFSWNSSRLFLSLFNAFS